MKATILQEHLKKAIGYISKNVSTKAQLPILSHVLITTDNERIKIASTNLETSICFWVGGSVSEEGHITVPARLFTDVINSFPQDKVILETKQKQIKLTCGTSEASIATTDGSEFPPLPEATTEKDASVDVSLLSQSLPFVSIAASTDETRPLLTGIKFLEKDGNLLMVATDGYRLSIKTMPPISGIGKGLVIPARAFSDAIAIAEEEKSKSVDLFLSDDTNQMMIVMENALIATRLIEGEYPPFAKIIPAGYSTRITFQKDALVKAVKFASVFAREAANVIRLSVTEKEVTISANSPQLGDNKTSVAVSVEGEPSEIAFNARFVLDILNVFPGDEVILEMNGALSPGVFKSPADESLLHLIMPIRLQG